MRSSNIKILDQAVVQKKKLSLGLYCAIYSSMETLHDQILSLIKRKDIRLPILIRLAKQPISLFTHWDIKIQQAQRRVPVLIPSLGMHEQT